MWDTTKQRYTVESSLKRMRYFLVDHKEGCVIDSISARDPDGGKALFDKAIELNRLDDDDNLYLDEIKNL